MLKKDYITNAETISKSEVLNAYGLKLQITINEFFLQCFIDHQIQMRATLVISKIQFHLLLTRVYISDIIITGDLNLNCLTSSTRRKIEALCTQFMLFQSFTQPTHFNETSSSLIDVILVSNKEQLVFSGVGDPFLHQDVRYHCPVFGILKVFKPKFKAFKRQIWSYNNGLLRNKSLNTDWDSLKDEHLNTYARNINNSVLKIASECIPNK